MMACGEEIELLSKKTPAIQGRNEDKSAIGMVARAEQQKQKGQQPALQGKPAHRSFCLCHCTVHATFRDAHHLFAVDCLDVPQCFALKPTEGLLLAMPEAVCNHDRHCPRRARARFPKHNLSWQGKTLNRHPLSGHFWPYCGDRGFPMSHKYVPANTTYERIQHYRSGKTRQCVGFTSTEAVQLCCAIGVRNAQAPYLRPMASQPTYTKIMSDKDRRCHPMNHLNGFKVQRNKLTERRGSGSSSKGIMAGGQEKPHMTLVFPT